MRKTACITGASRGIGRAAALKFAGQGYDLALCCAKNETALQETAAAAEQLGSRTLLFVGDLGDPEACGRFAEAIRKTFGRLDVLVNNAGISKIGLIQDLTPGEWEELINVNLTSVYNTCHFAVPLMLRQHSGRIINISSQWGCAGASTEAAYAATQGGVNAFTRAGPQQYTGERHCLRSDRHGYEPFFFGRRPPAYKGRDPGRALRLSGGCGGSCQQSYKYNLIPHRSDHRSGRRLDLIIRQPLYKSGALAAFPAPLRICCHPAS